ncbi:SpoIIIAC/SpoIIIAD family protein [Anaerofustis sp.]|uniref:SpoIIIAC/SpoIIIAD family protein n=1 Tax=Anaerofustis sp. TaxID=1872517 RepID=UPI0025BF3447|nr:SpoIIIAC/SpoIIIAD family protein [Anaerofustis sp.]
MDIIKIAIIGILGTVISLFFIKDNKEYAIFISIIAGIIILSFAIKYLYGVIDVINTYSLKANMDMLNIKAIFKIIATSYIGQFASELCLDAGNKTLSTKISFFAKIMIIYFSLPLIISLFSYIEEVL